MVSEQEHTPALPEPLSASDERTWAMIAQLSILANLITGFLGPLIALVIYIVYKDRSRYVAYQSLQALVFQLIFWVAAGFLAAMTWVIALTLTPVLCLGCLIMPPGLFLSLVPIAALIYGVLAGIRCSQGEDFKYWLIGDWLRGTYEADQV